MWHCFLVCGCDCMQHVPSKVFTLSGHPIQVVGAFVNPKVVTVQALRTGHIK